jgi:plasmid stabilization system protein ParE
MPRLIITEGAFRGIQRCRLFLAAKDPAAARRAAEAIRNGLLPLQDHPEMGRPHSDLADCRELLIDFGDAGYVLLYRYVPAEKHVYVLAFRHQKEAGY